MSKKKANVLPFPPVPIPPPDAAEHARRETERNSDYSLGPMR
jgi:hypothetical protein